MTSTTAMDDTQLISLLQDIGTTRLQELTARAFGSATPFPTAGSSTSAAAIATNSAHGHTSSGSGVDTLVAADALITAGELRQSSNNDNNTPNNNAAVSAVTLQNQFEEERDANENDNNDEDILDCLPNLRDDVRKDLTSALREIYNQNESDTATASIESLLAIIFMITNNPTLSSVRSYAVSEVNVWARGSAMFLLAIGFSKDGEEEHFVLTDSQWPRFILARDHLATIFPHIRLSEFREEGDVLLSDRFAENGVRYIIADVRNQFEGDLDTASERISTDPIIEALKTMHELMTSGEITGEQHLDVIEFVIDLLEEMADLMSKQKPRVIRMNDNDVEAVNNMDGATDLIHAIGVELLTVFDSGFCVLRDDRIAHADAAMKMLDEMFHYDKRKGVHLATAAYGKLMSTSTIHDGEDEDDCIEAGADEDDCIEAEADEDDHRDDERVVRGEEKEEAGDEVGAKRRSRRTRNNKAKAKASASRRSSDNDGGARNDSEVEEVEQPTATGRTTRSQSRRKEQARSATTTTAVQDDNNDDDDDDDDEEEEEDRLRGLSVIQLRKICRELKLSQTGKKDEMIQRIKDYNEKPDDRIDWTASWICCRVTYQADETRCCKCNKWRGGVHPISRNQKPSTTESRTKRHETELQPDYVPTLKDCLLKMEILLKDGIVPPSEDLDLPTRGEVIYLLLFLDGLLKLGKSQKDLRMRVVDAVRKNSGAGNPTLYAVYYRKRGTRTGLEKIETILKFLCYAKGAELVIEKGTEWYDIKKICPSHQERDRFMNDLATDVFQFMSNYKQHAVAVDNSTDITSSTMKRHPKYADYMQCKFPTRNFAVAKVEGISYLYSELFDDKKDKYFRFMDDAEWRIFYKIFEKRDSLFPWLSSDISQKNITIQMALEWRTFQLDNYDVLSDERRQMIDALPSYFGRMPGRPGCKYDETKIAAKLELLKKWKEDNKKKTIPYSKRDKEAYNELQYFLDGYRQQNSWASGEELRTKILQQLKAIGFDLEEISQEKDARKKEGATAAKKKKQLEREERKRKRKERKDKYDEQQKKKAKVRTK